MCSYSTLILFYFVLILYGMIEHVFFFNHNHYRKCFCFFRFHAYIFFLNEVNHLGIRFFFFFFFYKGKDFDKIE